MPLHCSRQALPALAREPVGSAAAAVAAAVAVGEPAAGLAAAAATVAARVQLVHRDVHAGNVLMLAVEPTSGGGGGGPKVAGIVDWDHLCWGCPAFDLAYFANQLGKWVALSLRGDPAQLADWEQAVLHLLVGYRAACPAASLAGFTGLMLVAVCAPHQESRCSSPHREISLPRPAPLCIPPL